MCNSTFQYHCDDDDGFCCSCCSIITIFKLEIFSLSRHLLREDTSTLCCCLCVESLLKCRQLAKISRLNCLGVQGDRLHLCQKKRKKKKMLAHFLPPISPPPHFSPPPPPPTSPFPPLHPASSLLLPSSLYDLLWRTGDGSAVSGACHL